MLSLLLLAISFAFCFVFHRLPGVQKDPLLHFHPSTSGKVHIGPTCPLSSAFPSASTRWQQITWPLPTVSCTAMSTGRWQTTLPKRTKVGVFLSGTYINIYDFSYFIIFCFYIAEFFNYLNTLSGPLTLHSTIPHVVQYTRQALQWIRISAKLNWEGWDLPLHSPWVRFGRDETLALNEPDGTELIFEMSWNGQSWMIPIG